MPTHPRPAKRGEGRGEGLTLLFLLLFLACGDPKGGRDGGAPLWAEGSLELGAEAPDGGALFPLPLEVQATPGAQGGFHLPVLYRVTAPAVPNVVFDHRVTRTRDEVLVSKGNRTMNVEPVAAGQSWTSPGAVIIFICPTPVGVNVVGEELNFEVTATTKAGELLGKASGRATFRCAPNDAFCASICSG